MSPEDTRLVESHCPAKINLTLAILGRREDGFHNLHSIVAQTAFGDSLRLAWTAGGEPGEDSVTVEGGESWTGDNSVAAAIRLFREAAGMDTGRLAAVLAKRIPLGAGLGGGSSDAVAALKGLRRLFPESLPEAAWPELSARIGSDCPLFFSAGPVIMEGRGERIRPLPEELAGRLRGRRVLLFKPGFAVNTAEAYRRLAAAGGYSSAEAVEAACHAWRDGGAALPPAGNDFERLMADWIPSLPIVLGRLRERHGLDARLSGSGSACCAFPEQADVDLEEIQMELEAAWGGHYWWVETTLK